MSDRENVASTWLTRVKRVFWPIVGLVAVVWSIELLFVKLEAEVSSDSLTKALLDQGGLWNDLKVIAQAIGERLGEVTLEGYLLAGLATLGAYAALAWYDRIALIHLGKEKGISWTYIAVCSFVTYALGHNIGASVLSGGMVRLRAYSIKGLSVADVAILVALCSFTFGYGTVLLFGLVLLLEPGLLAPLVKLAPFLALPEALIRMIGFGLLALCGLYVIGSWRQMKLIHIGAVEIIYPSIDVVARQLIAAPMELLSAAAIVYFVLPEAGNPGYLIVLGAFLTSFSSGLLAQVPGGIGVMEAVFLVVMTDMAPTSVVAALLIWRLLYLLIPLAVSAPIILAFEHTQLKRPKKV